MDADLVWSRLAAVLVEAGCSPTPWALVTQQNAPFQWVSDLERERVVLPDEAPMSGNVTVGGEPVRVLRRGFTHRRWGWVSLGLGALETGAASALGELRPWEVCVGTGGLGGPAELLSKADRAESRSLHRWAERVLVASASAIGASHGGMGVEVPPFPAELRDPGDASPT